MSDNYWKNRVDTCVIDRSGPHRQGGIMFGANGLPNLKSTILDELRRGMFLRRDVAMVNEYNASGNLRNQTCVYLSRDGIEWNGQRDRFTNAERNEIEAMRQRIIAEAEEYPEMAWFLGDSSWMVEHIAECNAARIAHYEECALRQPLAEQQSYRERFAK